MRFKAGSSFKKVSLPAIDGSNFDSDQLKGKPFMLSFFRFATCPFCNMRVHELVKKYDELGDNFSIIAVFDSPYDNLVRHTSGHKAPFPILADSKNKYYKLYGIEYSVIGMLKGMTFRLPTMVKGMLKGHIPLPIKGNLTTMPADFLVDRNGIIQLAYYGQDEGDHLDFEKVKAFSNE